MKALDTNAIVRFLVVDDENQAQVVRNILLDAEKKGDSLFVSLLVILETIWVLSSVYNISREDIIQALENLLILSVLQLECHERIATLCRVALLSNTDIADLLIGLTAKDAGCTTTLTFDKKASDSDLFTLLTVK